MYMYCIHTNAYSMCHTEYYPATDKKKKHVGLLIRTKINQESTSSIHISLIFFIHNPNLENNACI